MEGLEIVVNGNLNDLRKAFESFSGTPLQVPDYLEKATGNVEGSMSVDNVTIKFKLSLGE